MGLASGNQILRAIGFALLVAVPGGLLLGWLRWVGLWAAVLLGLAIGSAALVGSGRHRDASVQVVAGVMACVGMMITAVILAASRPGQAGLEQVIVVLSYRGFLVPLLAAIIAAIARFRF
jgi:hypothetical protein